MEKENTTDKSEIVLREESILEFWKKKNIFQKTLEKSSPKGEFIFYEGPPTANGKPGIHHLEARAFKDVIPRYKTMQGFNVRRKGGWDTHGLPVELQVEKKLGLNSKKAIEDYGIAKFNQQCKESVWEYLDIWNKFTKRIGFWVDQENPYVTYHNSYIESVWNILKKVDNQNLFYKDYKVVPWCPRCGTVLSSHELAQGYKNIKDLSVYVKFKVKKETKTYLLAWTTTPWTLPGNVALAVGKDIIYVKIEKENEFFILAKKRLSAIEGEYKIVKELKGKDLIGLEYEPLYLFLEKNISEKERSKLEKAYKVYSADFVTTEDGTGIVHTAVMYGQDDFVLGTEIGLPKYHLVGLDGKFLVGTEFLENRFVRDEDVAIDIIKDLAHRGLLLKKERYEHSYPHCWRCKTALIYYARDSWYIKMSDSKIKSKMIEENKKIKWNPAYIRDGRFGEWLKDIKDWAISRERYWGTPLPVWKCESCKKFDVIGSLEELKLKTKKSGNSYFVMRHGEAIDNIKRISNSKLNKNNKLTKKGIQDIKNNIEKYKNEKLDFIFCSPLFRTKETASIVADILNFDKKNIIFDERLWELKIGDFDGKKVEEFRKYIKSMENYFLTSFPNGESRLSMYKRVGNFIYELENKYSNKKILIISHGDPIMTLGLINKGYTEEEIKKEEKKFKYFKTGEIRKFDFSPLPHNENFELDLHRPYIDEIKLMCKCGTNLTRTKEVMDVWFDSGAMPFAQDHYPFENKKWIDGKGYPADFITEAIDQTRGWFYTLHAIGTLMGHGKAFKNVISLGLLLDSSGKKMSKSIGNIVDPFIMIEKYGVDTLRLWMYGVNQPGESKNFDEKTVLEFHRQFIGLLYNVLAFYELYRDKNLEFSNFKLKPTYILDKWILIRLDELVKLTTENLDNYKLFEPTRAIRDFICDLSTWYLRRSRDRIKNGNKETKQILYFVLKTLAKIMAPFAPFIAEDIWQKLKVKDDLESIHLTKWPTFHKSFLFNIFNKNKSKRVLILEKMEITRKIITLALQARQKAGISVRQPLASLKLKVESKKLSSEYINLIKDEINVKKIIFEKKSKIKNLENSDTEKITLDTKITPELKEEGNCREFTRAIQTMRKKIGLTPNNLISLTVGTDEIGKKLIQKFEANLLKVVMASKIEFKENDGEEIKINELVFKIKIS